MGFFSQAWFGICKELSIYKNNPKLLLHKSASVFVFAVLTVIFGKTNGSNLKSAAIANAIWQIELYFMPTRVLLYKVSSERAENFKEYLMINGMTKSAYQAKIAVSNYLEMFFFALPQSIGLYFTYQSHFENFTESRVIFELFFILFFAGISVVNMSLFISTLLTPQIAQNVGSILILLLGLLYFAATAIKKLPAYIIFSLHPPAGMALAINALLPADQTEIVWDGYTGALGLIILFISSFVYLALYLYKERNKDADLRVSKKKKIRNAERAESLDRRINLVNNPESESRSEDLEQSQAREYNSALYYEKLNGYSKMAVKKTIEALELMKIFNECTAVNGISFAIYEEEIFCLLGHNGAGKTTLVNMLTGLIPKTSGTFLYNGEEVHSNLDKIRGHIGFCPQKDFLLMENTVYENLSFFAEIKKVPSRQIANEIERVMTKLGLTQFKNMPAKKLSGGFKRKLNVGIALLKDPKIIIMDEPTSGMDPVSRRSFWNIIKDLKNEKKTVVLTTQFLDEAEELADRVAIMTKGSILLSEFKMTGKLFALGTTEFIQQKFGAGYKLIIHNSNHDSDIQTNASEIMSKVQSVIPSALRHYDTNSNVLQFTLPFKEQGNFSNLFLELEKTEDLQLSLQMVTLEETFVNLGINGDHLLQNAEEKYVSEIKSPCQKIPSSFAQKKIPTFKDQLYCVLTMKLYKIKNNKALLFFSSFPLLFIIGGIGISNSMDDKKAGVQMVITMLLTGNAFLMNTFAIPPAMERITRIMHTLKAMGLRPLPHWIGNLIVDFGLKIVMCLALIVSIYAFQLDYLIDAIGSFIALYLAFSFNMIVLTYNLSLAFNNLNIVMAAAPSILMGGFVLPTLLNAIFSNFNINGFTVYYIISFVFLGPATFLQLGVNALAPSEFADPNSKQFAPFKESWAYTLIALGLGLLLFFKLLYTDSKIFELKEKKVYRETTYLAPEQDDNEVSHEKERLVSTDNQDLIKLIDVQKTYPNGFKALRDLSFGVEEGQIFCLLGPNGAGKTTAFDIITASIPKTKGKVQLQGQELSRSASDIFYEVGICPQSNTLWDFLTPRQHLKIYALLKGMKGAEIEEAIDYLIKVLQIEEYVDRGVQKLSGGNKRKLCVAISMIGAPKLIFLDEPSTGMDPLARRNLWTLIKDVMKKRQGAMVLTTHYMQEAELVSDKLGILVNGRFVTIGKMSELKKKFGEYSIVVRVSENSWTRSEIEQLIKSILPEVFAENISEENAEYIFKVPAIAMKFAKIFSLLEQLRVEKKIQSFSVYTTTLEQIFIKLAKNQRSPNDLNS